jgi:hypothetical protein
LPPQKMDLKNCTIEGKHHFFQISKILTTLVNVVNTHITSHACFFCIAVS